MMSSTLVDAINNATTSTTTTSSTTDSSELGEQDFLQLLIAQLQNQDPLNPVENQEFVAQLATFSSLEQQQQQTELLQELINSQNNNTSAQALALIGKEVSVAVSEFTIEEGQDVDFTIDATEIGSQVVRIYDSTGEVVRTELLDISSTGEVEYQFDGKDDSGNDLPAGTYVITVGESMDEDGNVTGLSTFIHGNVDGVTFVDNQPILIVDGNATSFSDVYGVYEGTDTP